MRRGQSNAEKKKWKIQRSIYEHANLNRMSTSHVISHVNFCTRKIHHQALKGTHPWSNFTFLPAYYFFFFASFNYENSTSQPFHPS